LSPVHPVTVALALAGTCLVLLVPYLWSFKQRMDPERMAVDEGRRARRALQNRSATEPEGVAALDNIVMSAYGYRDYDTFVRGLTELSEVGLLAWRHYRVTLGQSIFRRIAQIGVTSVEDPRGPFQVIETLGHVGASLVDDRMQEASRQAAVAMSEIGEVAVEKGLVAVTRQVALALSSLGARAADHNLVAVAEETAYSLGHLGVMAAQRGMEDSTRQLAVYLRRVGVRAVHKDLDLVTRQAMVSLWTLGGIVYRYLPDFTEVVARELEMMERVTDAETVDVSYLSAPQTEALGGFRSHYLKDVRNLSDDAVV
jgi:hypothetical protein